MYLKLLLSIWFVTTCVLYIFRWCVNREAVCALASYARSRTRHNKRTNRTALSTCLHKFTRTPRSWWWTRPSGNTAQWSWRSSSAFWHVPSAVTRSRACLCAAPTRPSTRSCLATAMRSISARWAASTTVLGRVSSATFSRMTTRVMAPVVDGLPRRISTPTFELPGSMCLWF